MNVTSNHYRDRNINLDVIQVVHAQSRRLQLSVDASFDSTEPLRPSELTLLRLARHYQAIHRTLKEC